MTKFLLLIGLTLSLNAFGTDFCSNPYKVVCENSPLSSITTYNNNLKEIRAQVSKLEKEDKFKKNSNDILPTVLLVEKMIEDKFPASKGFFKDNQVINQYKQSLIHAINNSDMSSNFKLLLTKKIEGVKFYTFAEYLTLKKVPTSAKSPSAKLCGEDGLFINAFAESVSNTSDYIVICPGFVLKNAATNVREDIFTTSFFTIVHELSHHIDHSIDFGNNYRNFQKCIKENFELNKNPIFCRLQPNSNYCLTKAGAKMRELISDAWAYKAMALYMKANQFSIDESMTMYKKNVSFLCKSGSGITHQSAEFRISTQVKYNADLNYQFSCNYDQTSLKECSF